MRGLYISFGDLERDNSLTLQQECYKRTLETLMGVIYQDFFYDYLGYLFYNR